MSLGTHWLTSLASRAGLDASDSGLPPDASPDEAWPWIADFLEITQWDLAQGVANSLRLSVADLQQSDPGALMLLPADLAKKRGVLPLRATDRELVVATSDPLDVDAEHEIAFLSSRRTIFEVCPPEPLMEAVAAAYSRPHARETVESERLDEAFARVQLDPSFSGTMPDDPEPIIKVLRLILYEASTGDVGEIHIAPRGSVGRVQFEEDGQLRTFIRLPLKVLTRVVQRLRGLAQIPFSHAERQSGQIPFRIAGAKYAVTVHTVPSSTDHLVLEMRAESAAPAEPGAAAKKDWQPSTSTTEGHILIVDDDEGGRMLMRTVLEKNGFEVTEADDGATAIPFLQRAEDIDGILLDLMMKTMDGLETLKKIRKSMKTAALPVVILTASEDPEDEQRLLKAGADDYLRKPVDPLQLVVRIKSVLKRARS